MEKVEHMHVAVHQYLVWVYGSASKTYCKVSIFMICISVPGYLILLFYQF